MVDLPFLAELLLALLVVATLDGPPPVEPAQEPPPTQPELPAPLPGGWSAETDLHAQRLLRLERRRDTLASQP